MRRRLKRAMLLLLAALAALLMFVGCELGMTKDQALNAYDLKASVTYYANGGDFGNGNTTKEIWYTANSRPLNIGVDPMPSGTSINLKYDKHDFGGWYHVALDEDGKPIVDTETGLCELDMTKPVEFTTAVLLEDDAWHLGALWNAKAKVRVRLVSDGVITDSTGVTFDPTAETDIKVSDYVPTNDYKSQLNIAQSPISLPASSAYQFVGYYFDQAATQPILEELRQQEGQTEDVIVYAKYISKEYTVVKTANEVKSMFVYLKDASKKFYIARDIDMSGTTGIPSYNNLAATVEGNGFTISNLSFVKQSISGKYALFNTVKATANVKDLNFTNISIECALKAASDIYFVFAACEEGATIENVIFQGTMSVGGNTVNNMLNGFSCCLFGGFENDAAYTAANPNGFKVVGNPEDFITIK